MSHILIIGGTGMLGNVTEFLSKGYSTVSVICRNRSRINSNLKNINPLILDYSDYKFLSKSLQTAIEEFGNIELVVSWIHSSAPLAPNIIAEKINSYNHPFIFFDILGSVGADPAADNSERENKLILNKNLIYKKIILGFKIENGSSRWLTNEEISSGIIEAVKTDAHETIIGTVAPWNMKP